MMPMAKNDAVMRGHDISDEMAASWRENFLSDPLEFAAQEKLFHRLLEVGLPHSKAEEFSFIKKDLKPYFEARVLNSNTLSPENKSWLDTLDKNEPKLVFANGALLKTESKVPELNFIDSPGSIFPDESESDAFAILARLGCRLKTSFEWGNEKKVLNIVVLDSGDGVAKGRWDLALNIRIPAGKTVTIALHQRSDKSGNTGNAILNVHLEKNSSLVWNQIEYSGEHNSWFSKVRLKLDKNSVWHGTGVFLGSFFSRHALEIEMAGPDARAEWSSATILQRQQESHQWVQLKHAVPAGYSRQNFRSAVTGRSRASVNSSVQVSERAVKSDAGQLIRSILLSDLAKADCKPTLYIKNDDVKCSHGSATGALDREQLFYLLSRGFSETRARSLLLKSFMEECAKSLFDNSIRQELEKSLDNLEQTTDDHP